MEGHQHTLDGQDAYRVTVTGKDGKSATFWALERPWVNPHYKDIKRPWVVCSGIESGSHYSRHATFHQAAAAANLRARRWLGAGRRLARIRAARGADRAAV